MVNTLSMLKFSQLKIFTVFIILLISSQSAIAKEETQKFEAASVVTQANNSYGNGHNVEQIFHHDDITEKMVYAANFGGIDDELSAHLFAQFAKPELPKGHILKRATLHLKRLARQKKNRSQSILSVASIGSHWNARIADSTLFNIDTHTLHVLGKEGELSQSKTKNSSVYIVDIDISQQVQDWIDRPKKNNGLRISVENSGGHAVAFSGNKSDISISIESSARHSCNNCDNKPNVILIMTDDQGWGDAGFTQKYADGSNFQFENNELVKDYSGPKTPNLDELAYQGLIFNNFHSGAPVCSPTRGTALTGRNNYRLGIKDANDGRLETSEVTLAEALKYAGYRTGHFGKWHLGTMSTTIKDSNRGGPSEKGQLHYSPPYLHGYDVSFSTEAKVPTYDPMKKGSSRRNPPSYTKNRHSTERHKDYYGTAYWEHNKITGIQHRRYPHMSELQGDDSAIVMEKTLDFIETASKAKDPFLAVVWFHTPHLPIGHKRVSKDNGLTRAIEDMDHQVGNLHAKLQELDLDDNTMIWFASDNGPEEGTKGSSGVLNGRKRSLLDGGTKVPGFLYWPNKISEHYRSNIQASTMDYYPTITQLLGINLPNQKHLDGESLLNVINYAGKPRHKHNNPNARKRKKALPFAYLYSHTTYKYGLIYKGCKILAEGPKNRINRFRLFNLVDNPREIKGRNQTNTCQAYQKELRMGEMKTRLNAWIQSVNKESDGKFDYPSI